MLIYGIAVTHGRILTTDVEKVFSRTHFRGCFLPNLLKRTCFLCKHAERTKKMCTVKLYFLDVASFLNTMASVPGKHNQVFSSFNSDFAPST